MITQLHPSGLPGKPYSFTPSSGLVPKNATDTATPVATDAVSVRGFILGDTLTPVATDEDVTTVGYITGDSSIPVAADAITGKNFILGDSGVAVATDIASLQTSGVIPKAGTDSSVPVLTEAATVLVQIAATDTAVAALADVATQSVIEQFLTVTDTATPVGTDIASKFIIGVVSKTASDTATAAVSEVATVVKTIPPDAPRQRTLRALVENRTIYVK